MRPLLIIVVSILALFLFKTFYLDADSSDSSQPMKTTSSSKANSTLAVDIYVAKEVSRSNSIYSTGTTVANEEVEIKSEVAGRLIKLNSREGGFVQKGQLIAKLDDSDIRSLIKKIEYEEQLADQVEARQKKLLEIDAISKEEYDMAVNRVNTLNADKEYQQVQLQKTVVNAPFSGRMGLKNISEGAYITPGVVIGNLVQSNPIKLDFSVPEKYANMIKNGQEVRFSIDGDDHSFIAKVVAIDPKIDNNLRTLMVRAQANNNEGSLLPGMFVQVEIPLGEAKAIMIPTESILPVLKGKKVFVMKNGKAVEVSIKTGLRTDTHIQVEEGLAIGDSVVVSALMSMKQDLPIGVRDIID